MEKLAREGREYKGWSRQRKASYSVHRSDICGPESLVIDFDREQQVIHPIPPAKSKLEVEALKRYNTRRASDNHEYTSMKQHCELRDIKSDVNPSSRTSCGRKSRKAPSADPRDGCPYCLLLQASRRRRAWF